MIVVVTLLGSTPWIQGNIDQGHHLAFERSPHSTIFSNLIFQAQVSENVYSICVTQILYLTKQLSFPVHFETAMKTGLCSIKCKQTGAFLASTPNNKVTVQGMRPGVQDFQTVGGLVIVLW